MKIKNINLILGVVVFISKIANASELPQKQRICFTENNGQVCDQNYNSRKDVLFSGTYNGMVYHLTKKGVCYQLSRVDVWEETQEGKKNIKLKIPTQTTIYRVDINWLGSNSDPKIEASEPQKSVENFYLQNCQNGILNVKSYKDIIYKDVYKDIDLKWYEKNGSLEYDFILKPHADVNTIKFEIKGAQKLVINDKGELEIKTPLGAIIEKAPVAYQNNKEIKAEWVLVNNILSFKVADYNKNLPLIIDPVIRVWGTYYGSSGLESGHSCITDGAGDVYMAGTSSAASSVIATTGSHQTIFGGGSHDAFLVKFDNAGVRQWATYYGGSAQDIFYEIKADASGNIYATGETQSSAAISTPGAHQNLYAGGSDAMLIKFNSSGVRQWATYYGTTGNESAFSCAIDATGDVYIAGHSQLPTPAGTIIATAGSHQTTNGFGNASFLAKFNSSGVRQWATYYGGSNIDQAHSCTTDASGNVFMAGRTKCSISASISTTGSHQPAYGGATGDPDAYLVKFNSSGVRQWGTFYGGIGSDDNVCCATDGAGNIYLGGQSDTQTSNVISTAGSHQPLKGAGGTPDAFLAKFNSSGVRQWGTYYGGLGNEGGYNCITDGSNNVYLSGRSSVSSGTAIAVPGNHQSTVGGNDDAFLVKFNSSGVRQWGTYYGGAGYESGYSCAIDASNNLYLCGNSDSNAPGTEISTAGSHQVTNGGSDDAFLVKFTQCTGPPSPVNNTPLSNQTICSGSTTTLNATGSGTINWFGSSTSTVVLGTGTSFVTSALPTGSFIFYASVTNTCSFSYPYTAVSITVNPNPVITVNSGTVCYGDSFTITPSGASTYTISGGSSVVTVTTPATYTVTGTNSFGCQNVAPAYCNVSINFPATTLTITTSNSLICVGQSATLTATGANSYTWNTSATSSVIVVSPTTTTSYTATAIDATSGCPINDIFSQSVSPCTGTDFMNFEEQGFIKVYPNPTKDNIIIDIEENAGLTVYNVLGKILIKINLQKGQSNIILSELNSGMYYFVLKTDSNTTIKKIIKN